jgi:hypothetical protein
MLAGKLPDRRDARTARWRDVVLGHHRGRDDADVLDGNSAEASAVRGSRFDLCPAPEPKRDCDLALRDAVAILLAK